MSLKVPDSSTCIRLARQPDGAYTRRLERMPIPALRDHDVLVRMRAVSIQRVDIEVVPDMPEGSSIERNGLVAGSDGAGEIVQMGRLVKSVYPGQRVVTFISPSYLDHPLTSDVLYDTLGESVNGVHGDYIVLKEAAIVPMPGHLSWEEAAAIPASGITAWSALGMEKRAVQPTSIVLVEGTGGVSTFALLFAVAMGAKVVVTSSSDDKLQRMLLLGATWGVNYQKFPDWGEEVLRQTAGHGADIVLDMGGQSTIEQSMKALAYEGCLALVGGLGGFGPTLPAIPLQLKSATVRGILGGPRSDYLRMCNFLQEHHIHPIIDKSYPFEQFEDAYQHLKSGNFVGKIVMKLPE